MSARNAIRKVPPAVAVLGALLCAPAAHAEDASPIPDPPAATVERPFAPDSFWNAPLADDAPLDVASGAYVERILRQVRWGTTINTSSYSVPIYTVPADQPTVRVTVQGSGLEHAALQQAFEEVPLPDHARPAAGRDGNLVVWQPETDRMWEFWRLARAEDGSWSSAWGGFIESMSTFPGYFGNPEQNPWWTDPQRSWGASASGLGMAGGLIQAEELASGRIDHAIAIAMPEVRYQYFSWPAQRTDGTSSSTGVPLEGMRFRLPPELDIDALGLPPATRTIAKAAQEYGLVLRDRASTVALFAEDPTPTGTNPYPALFGGLPSYKVLQSFPWDRLQALRPTVDRTAPVTTITPLQGDVVPASSASFAFGSDDPNVKMQCWIDTTKFTNCGEGRTFEGLADGDHVVAAQAIDRAGLYRTAVRRTFRVDTVAPQLSWAEERGPWVTTRVATRAFAGSEPVTSECRLDDGAWSACAGAVELEAPDGPHVAEVRAVDEAGHASGVLSWAFTVDTVPPVTKLVWGQGDQRATGHYQSTFHFTSSEAGSTFECRLDEGAWGACRSPKAYAYLPVGTHVFDVRAHDPAGNVDPAPRRRLWTILPPA